VRVWRVARLLCHPDEYVESTIPTLRFQASWPLRRFCGFLCCAKIPQSSATALPIYPWFCDPGDIATSLGLASLLIATPLPHMPLTNTIAPLGGRSLQPPTAVPSTPWLLRGVLLENSRQHRSRNFLYQPALCLLTAMLRETLHCGVGGLRHPPIEDAKTG